MSYYDKLLTVYGLDYIDKINKSSVLIYGSNDYLTNDIIRNLILCGINTIYLYNNKIFDIKNELNKNVNIIDCDNYKQNQYIMCIINQQINIVNEISNYCSEENIKLIVVWSKGISGVIHVDANLHLISDIHNYDIESVQVSNISKSGIVNCMSNHNLSNDDKIIFYNVEGDMETFKKEWYITVINKNTFQLNDFDILEFTFINASIKYINKPYYITHDKIKYDNNNDLINTYIQMFSNNLIDKMPELWSDDMNKFMENNNIILPHQAQLFHYELIPIVSIFSSIVASEIIKLITNKFTPISQWFSWTDETLLPINKPNIINTKTTLGKIYGIEFETKMLESNFLIIGSCSIGYELFKNLCLLGFKNFNIIKENETDIDKYKIIQEQNIKYYVDKIDINSTLIDDIITKQKITGLITALDNFDTRKIIDEKSFKYNLPLFDSGVDGLKGHIQSSIPFISETLSTTSDFNIERSFPLCMITNFPNEIYHIVPWVIEKFEFFIRAPKNLKLYLSNPLFIDELEENDKIIALKDIDILTNKYPDKTYYNKFAVDMFNEFFNDTIIKLLEAFPSDSKNSENQLFWSGGKKCPKPIIYNDKYEKFIDITNKILDKILDIKLDKILDKKLDKKLECFDNELYIEWVLITSNIRAENYSIIKTNEYEIRNILYKTISTTIMTTSIVSGLSVLEIIKYLSNNNNYKTTYLNLSEPSIINADLKPSNTIDIAGVKVNAWTKFEYKLDTTLQEFKEYYEEMFNTEITMIVIDTTMIYADFFDDLILKDKISKILQTHYDKIPLNIEFNLLSKNDIEIPNIIINLI